MSEDHCGTSVQTKIGILERANASLQSLQVDYVSCASGQINAEPIVVARDFKISEAVPVGSNLAERPRIRQAAAKVVDRSSWSQTDFIRTCVAIVEGTSVDIIGATRGDCECHLRIT